MDSARRRTVKMLGALVAVAPIANAQDGQQLPKDRKTGKQVYYQGARPDPDRLYSSAVSCGNLLFLAGKGAHFEGDIKTHTKYVLDEIEKELRNAGSSMEKVLKVNVYLDNIKDYAAMNEIYRGRFGGNPPARTTVSPAGGIPNGSLVEIEVVACL